MQASTRLGLPLLHEIRSIREGEGDICFMLAEQEYSGLRSALGGAAGKAANLVGCESPRRQLPDSDGEHIRGTAREQTVRRSDVEATAAPSLDEARR